MYNQHTGGMATTRHGNLVGRGGRKAFVTNKDTHITKKCQEKLIFMNLKKKDSST